MPSWKTLFFLLTASLTIGITTALAAEDMLDMDLESLMQVKLTSAGRKEQLLSDIPAAIYVLSHDDIQNSGVTSIPEALRLVPGIQVARISSNNWAISARGFSRYFSGKLLVQIDGRSVYTPFYSGVYWDAQNVVLEDIERIEVIRGPGATLWGANAVNGVINIITKSSEETQGGLVSVASGNHDKLLATARYGGHYGNTHGRFYLHQHNQDSYTYRSDSSDANDDWKVRQAGFRFDGDTGDTNNWTVQGDIYRNDMNQQIDYFWTLQPPYANTVQDNFNADGHNLLARWTHHDSLTESTTVQFYYDVYDRDEIYLREHNRVFDIDLQKQIRPLHDHDIVWGLGYRYNRDRFGNTFQSEMDPPTETTELFSAFVQDEITLKEDTLWLTTGIKVEHNDYTGAEYQPTLRLLWKPLQHHSFWAAVSRAVRTPSRIERSGSAVTAVMEVPAPSSPPTMIPVAIRTRGDSSFSSEALIAYEAGYRFSATDHFSVDMALFYNDYTHLRTFRLSADQTSIYFDNAKDGYSYGLELSTRWVPVNWLKGELNYSFIDLSVAQPFFGAPGTIMDEGLTAPQHQVTARLNLKARENLKLNFILRYVDRTKMNNIVDLNAIESIDPYTELDANLKWQLHRDLEITLAGLNLLDSKHLETMHDAYKAAIETGRSFYAKVSWNF